MKIYKKIFKNKAAAQSLLDSIKKQGCTRWYYTKLDNTFVLEYTLAKRTGTFKSIKPDLSNKGRYKEVVKALQDLEHIRDYGTVKEPHEVLSMMYPDRYGKRTVAQAIIDDGEIDCSANYYGVIIDLRDEILYVDYSSRTWEDIGEEPRCKGDLCSDDSLMEGIKSKQMKIHKELNKFTGIDYMPNNYILPVIDGLNGEVFYKQVDLVEKEIKKANVEKLNNSRSVANFLRTYAFENNVETYEQFYVIYLDRALNVVGLHHVSKGGIVGTVADIKLISEAALKVLASSVILSHNHPSGNLTPSQADINLTKNTKEALKTFEIAVVDHIIITKDSHYSFADESMLGLQGIKEIKFLKRLGNINNTTMITKHNYSSEIQRIGIENLTKPIQEMHQALEELMSATGKKMSELSDEEIKEYYADKQFEALQKWIDTNEKQPEPEKKIEQPKKEKKSVEKAKQPKAPKIEKVKPQTDNAKKVASIDIEVRFIKRYVSLHGKSWRKDQIHSLLSSLQAAIVKKQIRKTSEFAEEIIHLQKELIGLHNTMAGSSLINLSEKELSWLQPIAMSEKQALSVRLIVRYINLYKKSKKPIKERVVKLRDEIGKAVTTGDVPKNCPYLEVVKAIHTSLINYETSGKLEVQDYELNGLLGNCDCAGLGTVNKTKIVEVAKNPFPYIGAFMVGIASNVIANKIADKIKIGKESAAGTEEKATGLAGVINSNDLKNMQFETLHIKSPYLELIGDPSKNFKAMVFGPPKEGKSTFCINFAKYLAENHGKVLYCGIEEMLGYTIKEKFERLNAYHPNIDIAEILPDKFTGYDFIFIDSVTRAKLQVNDLQKMISDNPDKAFIFVFHTTKEGEFRGEQSFKHDVDIVIEVNLSKDGQNSIAKSYGRFSQGGTMQVF